MAKQEIHCSDGKKALCGSDEKAVKNIQQVTCPQCQTLMAQRAAEDKDPLIEVQVFNRGVKDGADFTFAFRRPAKVRNGKVVKRYPITNYRLISGAKHKLPLSVVEHLEKLSHPFSEYVENAPEGKSMQVAGTRHRFAIHRITEKIGA